MKTNNCGKAQPREAQSGEAQPGKAHPGGTWLTQRGLDLCAFPPGAHLFDLGCGAGASVLYTREQGYDCVGLDKMTHLPLSSVNGKAMREPFPFVPGHIENLPFADASADGILCECVLCLLDNPLAGLREMHRVCRTGASLLLSDLFLKHAASDKNVCLLTRNALEEALHIAGFRLHHFEDHSLLLKDFAARQIWYGGAQSLNALLPHNCPPHDCAYGLWIARKEP